ncbi:MAG TPA: branched-chain amino acid ABC transporter substrate-binding protein [Candidatus Dormibacteraeota bacterium]
MIACESSAPNTTPQPPVADILIASDMPITDFDGSAVPWQHAIQLALDQHHGKIGRFKLAYWSLDDTVAGAALQEKGIQNLERLQDDHRVLGVIGSGPSYVAAAEIPIANANPVPLVILSPSNTRACLTRSQPACYAAADELRPSGRNNFFRIAPPEPLQGAAMARYLVQHLNLRRAAAINEMGDDGMAYIDSFSDQLAQLGGELVLTKALDSGTMDFSEFMANARAKGAQAIYALGSPDDKVCVAASQMSPGMLFLGTDNFTLAPLCVKQAGDAANNMFGTLADVDATQLPDAKKVVDEYRTKYPATDPGSIYTFAAYDCANILIDAIEYAINANNGEIPKRIDVLNAVARANARYRGVTGTYTFDANGDAKDPLMSVYQVKGGQWTFVQRIDLV